MFHKIKQLLFAYCLFFLWGSCTSTNISRYYAQHQAVLDHIQQCYKSQYRQHPFSILFADKSFNSVSIEIITDSIKYIYEFAVAEKRISDTLLKYHLPVQEIESLILDMKSIHCTWIDNLDYYEEGKKNRLVYMSIRSKTFNLPLLDKKYYILTYYAQPQHYDSEGRLLTRRRQRQLRRINNEIFRRINDSVCYTISDLFR